MILATWTTELRQQLDQCHFQVQLQRPNDVKSISLLSGTIKRVWPYKNALVLASLPQGYHITNNELCDSHQSTTPNAREGTEYGQLQNGLG